MYTKFRLLIPLLLLFAGAANGQSAVIRGFVTDAASEQPLQGATVIIRNAAGAVRGVATDADGYFYMGRVAAGTHQLRITFIGFAPHEESLTVRPGEAVDRIIALEPQASDIDEVIVEAEAETGITAVAAGLERVRPADIARVPVPGVSGDLAAYVQTVPGVVLSGDRGGQFFIRGGSEDQNLALIDGLPVYGPFHVLNFYSAFPEEVIDRVDFYTGGYGAAHGERMSAILDVSARNGNKRQVAGEIAVAPFLSGLRFEGPIVPGRVSFIVSGRKSLVEELTPGLLGNSVPYRFGDGFAKVHALIGKRHILSFTGLLTDDRGDVAGEFETFTGDPVNAPETDSTEIAWSNQVFGGRYTLLPGRLPIRIDVTAGSSRLDSEFGAADDPERTGHIASTDARLDVTWMPSLLEIQAGGLWRRSDLGYRITDQFQDVPASSDETISEWAGYVTATLRTSGLTVEPGVRYYSVPDRSIAEFEPRFRADFSTGAHRFSVAAGRYHQAIVGLNDRRDIGNVFTAWRVVDDAGSLPQSTHAIAGWNGRIIPGLRLAAEAYYKRFDNLQVPVFSVFPGFATSLQPADGHSRGIDVRVAVEDQPFWWKSRLSGTVNYALSKTEYETAAGVIYPPGHDRRHFVNAVLTAVRDELSFSAQMQIGSGLPFTPSGGFDIYHALTPDTDVTADPGRARVLYAEPNSSNQPLYARVDAWLERRVDRGRYVATLRAGVVNLFNRSNLFYYDLYTFRRVNQLPLIPSVGFKVELR